MQPDWVDRIHAGCSTSPRTLTLIYGPPIYGGSGLLGALCGACSLQMIYRDARESDSEFIDRAKAELFGAGETDAITT